MTYSHIRAAGFVGIATALLATGVLAQTADISSLNAEDVLKLQIASGQTREQLEEQLADQLDFGTDDQFAARQKVKDYVETLFTQSAQGMQPTLTGSMPIRERQYDFDLKTYQICLPSSMLYKSSVEGGTVEALIGIRFDGLAEKNSDTCPFFKSSYQPGVTLGVANALEIQLEMSGAEKLHKSIVNEASMASFTCNELRFVPGRFDTGPTQLICAADKVDITVEGGQTLSYDAAASDDSWITRSGGESEADSGSMSLGTSEALGTAESNTGSDAQASTGLATDESSAAAATTTTPTTTTPTPPPIEPGTIMTEAALGLVQADRLSIQRRLNLLGYSTRGVDGVFGPGTRAGLTQWQIANALPVSGYLSASQLGLLNVTSETLYQNWLATNSSSSSSTTKTTKKKRKYYRGRDGCLRTRPGNARRTIIPGQSRFCNRRRQGKI